MHIIGGKIIFIIGVCCLVIECAIPKSAWLKWQESLNLAYPNEILCRIEMPKKTYLEGEPLVFRIRDELGRIGVKSSLKSVKG